ncbi:MAG: hypothetical protein QW757_00450 [Candidatus Woesearchaeota archaeon]
MYEWFNYNNNPIENIINIYFCVGGIPRYLELIEKPDLKIIEDLFLNKKWILLKEGKLLLKFSRFFTFSKDISKNIRRKNTGNRNS